MNHLVTVTVLLVLVVVLGGSAATRETRVPKNREVVAKQQTQFGLNMYKAMAEEDPSGNILFSPLSIGSALAMVYAGSREQTAEQMEQVLGFRQTRKRTIRGHRGLRRWLQKRYRGSGVTVKVTNGLYHSEGLTIRPKFVDRVVKMFGASVQDLDFTQPEQAAATINEQVEQDTAGHITDLVDPGTLSASTALVMVNAVFFKGTWLMQFEPNQTTEADFHALSGTRPVQMMKTEKQFPVGHVGSLNARALKLPYKGEDISMLILLPNEMDGIRQLDEQVNTIDFASLSWSLDSDDDVEVQLPRFKMEEKIDLKNILEKMGITSLFDQGEANLQGISGRQQIFVSDAVHQAGIEVTEEGTTATAATALGFSFLMLKPKPAPFIVDRLFLFVLREERTGATLFIGRVMEP